MRNIINMNADWLFSKTAEVPAALPSSWEAVTLPHPWNAVDGQDGGIDPLQNPDLKDVPYWNS